MHILTGIYCKYNANSQFYYPSYSKTTVVRAMKLNVSFLPATFAGYTVTTYRSCDKVHGYWSDWGEWSDCQCKKQFTSVILVFENSAAELISD